MQNRLRRNNDPHFKAVVTRTINRYRRAIENNAFRGTIPGYSDDPDEQAEIDAALESIDKELEASELALRRLINS